MGKMRVLIGVAIVGIVALGIGTVAAAHGNNQRFDERLTGYEEVPALSTPGNGSFRVFVDKSAQEIQWRLRDMLQAEYTDPDGEPLYCINSEVANLRIRLFRRTHGTRFRHVETIKAYASAHLEHAARMSDPGVRLEF